MKSPHSEGLPERVVLAEDDLDVPAVEEAELAGQNVAAEQLGQLLVGEDLAFVARQLIQRPEGGEEVGADPEVRRGKLKETAALKKRKTLSKKRKTWRKRGNIGYFI